MLFILNSHFSFYQRLNYFCNFFKAALGPRPTPPCFSSSSPPPILSSFPSQYFHHRMRTFPGREAQTKLLYSIIGKDDEGKQSPLPALIHLYDPNTPTSTLKLFRSITLPSSTVVVETDPLVDPTPASLFDKVLSTIVKDSACTISVSAGDSVDVFLGYIYDWLKATASNGSNLILVIQRAERLRDVWPEHIIESLYNFAELVSERLLLHLLWAFI